MKNNLLINFIFILFIVFTIVNLLYWLIVFPRIKKINKEDLNKKIDSDDQPVSIIISAKNEANNLKRLIPKLLKQNYKSFEILIVNDCSTDNTAEVISSFTKDYPVRLIKLKEDQPGKKHALSLAIKKAKNDLLLFTDADCLPISDNWISSMVSSASDYSMVLGYGPVNARNTWLNRYIRYETYFTALQYFSFAAWNRPYMGVGRNMLYTKTLFEENNAFESHKNLASGDDDLFVNGLQDKSKVTTCLSKDSFMYSEAKSDIISYYRQKTRHYSVSSSYKWIDKMSLGLYSLSHIALYILGIFLLFTQFFKIIILSFLLRYLLIMIFNKSSFQILDVKDLFYRFPMYDFLTFVAYIIFIPALFFPKNNNW